MFLPGSEATKSVSLGLAWAINGIEAVDVERGLAVQTTYGRTKGDGSRRWFVRRLDESGRKIDYSAGSVRFRAITLDDALRKLNEDTRLLNRIKRELSV